MPEGAWFSRPSVHGHRLDPHESRRDGLIREYKICHQRRCMFDVAEDRQHRQTLVGLVVDDADTVPQRPPLQDARRRRPELRQRRQRSSDDCRPSWWNAGNDDPDIGSVGSADGLAAADVLATAADMVSVGMTVIGGWKDDDSIAGTRGLPATEALAA